MGGASEGFNFLAFMVLAMGGPLCVMLWFRKRKEFLYEGVLKKISVVKLPTGGSAIRLDFYGKSTLFLKPKIEVPFPPETYIRIYRSFGKIKFEEVKRDS